MHQEYFRERPSEYIMNIINKKMERKFKISTHQKELILDCLEGRKPITDCYLFLASRVSEFYHLRLFTDIGALTFIKENHVVI